MGYSSCRIQKRRSFSNYSSYAQNNSIYNSRNCNRQDNLKYSAQFSSAKTKTCFSVRHWNRKQGFFRSSHYYWQNHNCQSAAACQKRKLPFQRSYKKQKSKQTVNNRRNSCKSFRRNSNHTDKTVSGFCIFCQINRRSNTNRNCHNKRNNQHNRSVYQCRKERGIFARVMQRKKRRIYIHRAFCKNINHKTCNNCKSNKCASS